MPLLKEISMEDLHLVHDWLRSMGMPVGRYLAREYSDGILVAKLLKKMFPRFVDLHNYQAKFSQSSKVMNWQTLNYKVLNRIGLHLPTEHAELIAKCEAGYVERLLWKIMNLTNETTTQCVELKKSDSSCRKTQKKTTKGKRCQKSATRIGGGRNASSIAVQFKERSERIGDANSRRQIPYEVHHNEINEIRDRIVALEYMLIERDNIIKSLLEHVELYEKANKAKKVVGEQYNKVD